MKELIQRMQILEARTGSCSNVSSDIRVIEMHIARAEEKVLRLGKAFSWTRSGLDVHMTEDL